MMSFSFRSGTFAIVAFALSACSGVGIDHTDPIYQEYKKLCETEAGSQIYQVIPDVDGVFIQKKLDTGLDESLLDYRYKFVEFDIPASSEAVNLRVNFVKRPGLHRFWLADANHENCRNFYDLFARWKANGYSRPTKYGNKCVASKPISKPVSKYKVFQEWDDAWWTKEPGKIAKASTYYTDIGGSIIYAEHHRFHYVPKNPSKHFSTGVNRFVQCPSKDSTDKHSPKLPSIFVLSD